VSDVHGVFQSRRFKWNTAFGKAKKNWSNSCFQRIRNMARRKKDPIGELIRAVGSVALLVAFAAGAWTQVNLVSILETVSTVALLIAGLGLVGLLIRYTFRITEKRFTEPAPASCPPVSIYPESNYSPPVSSPINLSKQLRSIDWFQFEKLMEIVYRKHGYTVIRSGGANADGGIDLVLERGTERIAVQCKHWKSWNVGVAKIRELVGAMTISGIPKGILVTISEYTEDAKALAARANIQLVGTVGVLELLETADAEYDPDIQACLNDTRKFCPKWKSEMVLRTAQKGKDAGSQFWGCSTYPGCRYTLQLAEAA
jgi:HJR/Mrr/RecB family endonuclease